MSDKYKFGQVITSSAGPTGETVAECRAIYVGQAGGTGNIGVQLQDGTSVLFKNVANGILPITCRGIHGISHGTYPTTAHDLVILV